MNYFYITFKLVVIYKLKYKIETKKGNKYNNIQLNIWIVQKI